ncbi:MAG: leukotriene A4 hydrolase C-terminal domain-containing protein, partial [Deltaproteobacteria bacterium]|nr:leukotriene A4 hydrolase C-terminal domain-containing protein [Deltaproteobacteria bacterium]
LQTHLEGVDPDEVYSQVPYEKGCLLLQRIEVATGREAFDRFLRTYISTFRFRSITTSDFLGLLKRELPQAAREVNLDGWLHGEGLPDDAAQPRSVRLETLTGLAQRLGKGDRPDEASFRGFRPNDWQVLLPRIPALAAADCAWMQERFKLMDSGNMEIRVGFLTHCARAGHQPAFPVVEKTLKGVGRMKYLRPLYTALKATPDGLALARRVFGEARAGYHPVARSVMEGLLKQT